MSVETKIVEQVQNGTNGHSNGKPDPANMRFNDIAAELERLPDVEPDRVSQLPAWARNPLQKARGFYLMVIKKTTGGSEGFVVTPSMLLVIILAFVGSLGGTIKILGDKIDAIGNAAIAKAAEDKVEKEWLRSELKETKTEGKINRELLRQALENDKQVLGYVQGSKGVRLEVKVPNEQQ